MSADMMLVCREEGSNFDGNNNDKAVFVTETSIGYAFDPMGDYLQRLYCNEVDIIDQLNGKKTDETYDIEITEDDVTLVKAIISSNIERHASFNDNEVIQFFEEHVGKKINIERW